MYVIEASLAEEPEAVSDAPGEREPGDDEARWEQDADVDLQPAPPESEPLEAPAHAHPDAGQVQEELAVPVPSAYLEDFAAPDVDDETFFAQLRGALDDDTPLGPREDVPGMLRWRDEAATAVAEAPRLYDQGQSEGRKFGLRKRRQRRRG